MACPYSIDIERDMDWDLSHEPLRHLGSKSSYKNPNKPSFPLRSSFHSFLNSSI